MRDKSSEAIDTSAAEAISVARTEFVSVWPQRRFPDKGARRRVVACSRRGVMMMIS